LSNQADLTLHERTSVGSLIGRETAMRTARSNLERARRGRGQVLRVTGEPGIGKSRLATEIVRLARRRGFGVYGGACHAQATTTSYLVWQPIWRALFHLDPSLPVPAQQAQLVARVVERHAGSIRRTPLLAPVVNLPMPDSELTASLELTTPVDPGDPKVRERFLRSLLLDHLRWCAAAAPLLLVLEDCHWIDPDSEDLLEFLARNVADQPVLILVTSRPVDAPTGEPAALASLLHFTEIRLGQLGAEEAGRLVVERARALGGEEEVPGGIVRQIVAWAGGNPLRLEELASFLLDQGTKAPRSGALAGLGPAEQLTRLVLARVARLDDAERATIEIASVLGFRFPAAWIWGVDPAAGAPGEVLQHLERLALLEFLHRDAQASEVGYAFKHANTKEAVYRSLSASRRERLHERVGQFIEQAYPGQLARFVDVLAYHYARAGGADEQRERKLRWFRAAADAAKAAFATETAIGYYEGLRALLPRQQTGQLLIELGDLLSLAARWPAARQAYEEALAVADLTGDPRIRAEGTRGLGSVLSDQEPGLAADKLRQAVIEFERLGDRHGLAKTLRQLAWTSFELGDYPEALAASERHLVLAAGRNDPIGMSAALDVMGIVRWRTGDHDEAMKLLTNALTLANEAEHRPGVILAANDLAAVRSDRGDHVQAIWHFRLALSAAEEIGDRRMAAIVIGNIGESHRRQGEYGRALRCFAHAFRITVEIGDRTSMANQAENLGVTIAAQGRRSEAEQLLARAITLARQRGAQYYLSEWLYQQGSLLASDGRLREAEHASWEAMEIAAERQQRGVELRARLLWTRMQVKLGRMERAAAIGELRALRDAWGEPLEQAAVLDALSQLDPSQEQLRQDAARLYRKLYEQAPTVEYREAYERLTGAALSPAPPLPAVPDSILREPFDFAEVVEQLDQVIGSHGVVVHRAG
jgi:tetratricopeptide (TPR) repeat protein